MSIAATVFTGIFQLGRAAYTGYKQTQAIEIGAEEAKKEKRLDLAQRNKELAATEKLSRDQMRQSQKQFETSKALTEKQMAEAKNVNARTAFRNKVADLTGILDKDKALENLFTNRLRALRT